jgi:hypothetical protein
LVDLATEEDGQWLSNQLHTEVRDSISLFLVIGL